MSAADITLGVIGVYTAIGAVFSGVFLTFGAKRLDQAAAAMPLKVRIVISPGCIALWPLLAVKWARGRRA